MAQGATLSLNPAIPVGRQLAQVLTLHLGLRGGALRSRQVELFEAVGLPDPERALSRYPHQFSGGQQQRIAIAIAISCQPEVLVLDEPTTGLDVTTQARISSLLRSLIEQTGAATLFVSHDLALLSTIADRLAVMYAGEIVEEGPTATIVRRSRHPYTRALLAAAPSLREHRSVMGIAGSPPPMAVLDACSFAPRCPHALETCRSGHVSLDQLESGHTVRCLRASDVLDSAPPRVLGSRAARAGDALLEVDELRCDYTGALQPAVRDVSFTVAAGETVGIVGESGSGKSTLLRALAGLHPPREGQICFDGAPLASTAVKRPRHTRGRIQVVFQNPDSSLNPRHTVAELVRRPVRLFRDDVARSVEMATIVELLESVKLPGEVLHRYPAALSGGQKQRVALARAFAAQPTLLLCDEVTSALDVSVQATVVELIGELARAFGTAVVFVSHDLAVVRTIASRALVMRDGSVCEEGSTQALFDAPQHPYTRELVAAIPEAGNGVPVGPLTLDRG